MNTQPQTCLLLKNREITTFHQEVRQSIVIGLSAWLYLIPRRSAKMPADQQQAGDQLGAERFSVCENPSGWAPNAPCARLQDLATGKISSYMCEAKPNAWGTFATLNAQEVAGDPLETCNYMVSSQNAMRCSVTSCNVIHVCMYICNVM